MGRLATKSKAGYREAMALRVEHGSLFGLVWSPAPLDSEAFGPLQHHGRPAERRECLWVAMSDGYLWYVEVDVVSGEVLTAHTTRERCNAPTREQWAAGAAVGAAVSAGSSTTARAAVA